VRGAPWTVAVDGTIRNESIQNRVPAVPRLDEACLKGVHGQRMKPATEDGEATVEKPFDTHFFLEADHQ